MTNLQIRDLKIEDLLNLRPIAMQELEYQELIENIKKKPEAIKPYLESSFAFFQDDKILAAGGINYLEHSDIKVGWAMVSKDASKKVLIKIVKFAREILKPKTEKIYITTRIDFPQAARACKFFGAKLTPIVCEFYGFKYQVWIWDTQNEWC